jgi:transcriptional regulator with XRE-family HTH domain
MKRDEFKNVTGERIRQCRKSHTPPLTQADLARCLKKQGLPILQDAISRIENRQLGISDMELIAIAKCLGVPVGFLCGE